MTKKAKFSALPTQAMLADAFGVTTRTIRNWKKKTGKNYSADRWLLLAEGRKLHERFIKERVWDKFHVSITLHGICPDHVTDPDKLRLWTGTHAAFAHPAAAAAIRPENALQLAAAKLRLAGANVTRRTLARELDVCVRTLYRPPYGAEKLREACRAMCDPTAPTERRTAKPKPKLGSGSFKLRDLAA